MRPPTPQTFITTTRITCTELWATSRPGSLNGNTTPVTALSCQPLDKWGALHEHQELETEYAMRYGESVQDGLA